MIKTLLESLLHLLILIPFTILFLKVKSNINYKRLLIFSLCYIAYQIFLILPQTNPIFDFIKSSWNWDGKILGLVCGFFAYFLFKNYFTENDFFTLKQNKRGFKPALIVAILIILLSTIVWFILGNSKYDLETLAFQISLPGLDEEIMFRGVLLGLLATSLKEKVSYLGNPSILITSILFGFMHALTIGKDNNINFSAVYFIQTGFAGYVWGWVTIKSKSILLAILSHNFSNFFGTLSTMIK
ncbi:CPBP family intramembrane metalloprotease [Weeksellaceae bacterium TAE3-ERU29]|nr:CPBP family intramembrane metalloprotease [Weeksellaceae bacterium TAE3-ERU29]